MSSFTATWYDEKMTEQDAPSMLPLETSPWLPMYEALVAVIARDEPVVDLGCGTGRFIELLRRKGHYAPVTGIDWSEAALAEAFEYSGAHASEPSFRREDLDEWEPDEDRDPFTVYVCSEVLEHLVDDIALVRKIPQGHRFLFTVPNFDSESHVRFFGDGWLVLNRYAEWLTPCSWKFVPADEWKGFHVVEAVR